MLISSVIILPTGMPVQPEMTSAMVCESTRSLHERRLALHLRELPRRAARASRASPRASRLRAVSFARCPTAVLLSDGPSTVRSSSLADVVGHRSDASAASATASAARRFHLRRASAGFVAVAAARRLRAASRMSRIAAPSSRARSSDCVFETRSRRASSRRLQRSARSDLRRVRRGASARGLLAFERGQFRSRVGSGGAARLRAGAAWRPG